MTPRERFCRIYDFLPVDRLIRWEAIAFWPEVLDQWRARGGLPEGVDVNVHYRFESQPRVSGGLGLTSINLSGPPVRTHVVRDDGSTRICRNDLGQVWEERLEGTSMPHWLKFPVESPTDWETKIEPRLRPDEHPYGDLDAEVVAVEASDGPRGFWLLGLYAFLRTYWGAEKLAYAFYDYPDTLQDMARCWRDMMCVCAPRILDRVEFDYALFHEDMAFKNGPLIGPNLYREFMTPYYREIIGELNRRGVRRIMIDSDGNNGALQDCFVEVGMNGLFPFEAAAGNDVLEIRRRYPSFVIYGAIDKRVLLGTRDDVRRELDAKVPPLWESGGFIPSIDHAVPPCPQENFEFYLTTLRGICSTVS